MIPTRIIKIYFCPYCSKIEREFETPFLFNYPDYECREACRACGKSFRVVDCIERCEVCSRRVDCLGSPNPITFAVAVVRIDHHPYDLFSNAVHAILDNIKRIIKTYGCDCYKKDFETPRSSQQSIYDNR